MKKALLLMLTTLAAIDMPAHLAAQDEPAVLDRLRSGEIVTRETDSDAAGASGRMQLLVRAPARAVWDVIVSCELAFAFVQGLVSCEVVGDSGDRAVVRQVVKQSWLIPAYDFVFESLRQPYEQIDVHLLQGNLQALDGSWSFREVPEGTLVDYRIRIQPSLPAPRFIVRRNINRGMPDMLACIRGLARGSGSAVRQQQDLERCPGRAPAAPSRQ
ncbi:MAG TPA: SRPBCC family protein [Xanthomonadales bacterium]|nr:SRPBCC family protein [Xanthomonadales bacterium]